jgi:hypothetical protein
VTILRLVVLLSVVCLLPADAFAQDEAERMSEVLCLDDPECLAMSRHRLTAESLRTMFAVDRELFALMKEHPDLWTRMSDLAQSINPQGKLRAIAVSAQVHEGIPELAQVLRRHKTTGHEYLMTHAVAMITAMAADTFAYEAQREGRSELPAAMMTPAMKFWRSMDPALKAEADAWKKMRGYDKGLNR